MMAARGNRRWPPGVVKLATWPRSAQRRSVPWLMPSSRLASPRLSHESNSPGGVSAPESGEICSWLSRASQIYAGSASTSVTPSQREPQIIPTHTADSLRWMRSDALVRLLPLAGAVSAVWLVARPSWLGVGPGWPSAQLAFGLIGLVLFFGAACVVQHAMTGRRGSLLVPASRSDAALQAGYYLINAPIEEAFFRGLVQGGLMALAGPAAGIALGTSLYVLYHRLGRWAWMDVLATSLVGLPMALAFWLLPGPPSLVGVSLAHVGATCGFLGPGPWLLQRLGLLRSPLPQRTEDRWVGGEEGRDASDP